MKRDNPFSIFYYFFLPFIFSGFSLLAQDKNRPIEFQEVKNEIPSVILEVRYFGTHNFIGKNIEGYEKPIVLLTSPTIFKLKKIQSELNQMSLGLKIFDGYRPQKAVDHFVRWAKDKSDTLMKSEFYPDVAKKDLFELEYIAAKSGHTRGSTVDLTLIELTSGKELDMGSPYDYFGKISWPFDSGVTLRQRNNRMLLRKVMLDNGFKPYDCEWWHFTLKEEPFPSTYFNFSVE